VHPAHTLTVCGLALLAALVACSDEPPKPRSDWVLRFGVVFLTEDLQATREPLAPEQYRLWFPYIVGDFYGSPDVPELRSPEREPDGSYVLDLNVAHANLVESLGPPDFMLGFMRAEPADARFARLAPAALEADGIELVGRAEWVDLRTRERLLLLYAHQPVVITGTSAAGGRTTRYDVRIPQAGYVWVAGRDESGGDQIYTVVPAPAELALAITPLDR